MRPIDADYLKMFVHTDDELPECVDCKKTEPCIECIIDNMPTIEPEKNDDSVGWIPFKLEYDEEIGKEVFINEMPNEYEDILVCHADGSVFVTEMNRDLDDWYFESGHEVITEIVAWMPLPKPYKNENKEES